MMMKNFDVVKSGDIDHLMEFNGGSLKGYVRTDFQKLCETFGPPTFGPFNYEHDKVTCEWKIMADNGLFITIYDWKMEATPLGLYDWHIGGHHRDNVAWVEEQVGIPAHTVGSGLPITSITIGKK
jgi:hypothetical protein